jgi:hypothetical protein
MAPFIEAYATYPGMANRVKPVEVLTMRPPLAMNGRSVWVRKNIEAGVASAAGLRHIVGLELQRMVVGSSPILARSCTERNMRNLHIKTIAYRTTASKE